MEATPSLGIKKGERETVRSIWLGVGPDLKGDSFTQPGNFMGPSVGKSLDRAEGSPWKRNKLHKAAVGISWGLRPSGVKSKAPETPFKAPIHPRCSTSDNGFWSPSAAHFAATASRCNLENGGFPSINEMARGQGECRKADTWMTPTW